MNKLDYIKWLYHLTVGHRVQIVIPLILNIIAIFLSIAFVELTKILFDNIGTTLYYFVLLIFGLISTKILQLFCEESEIYLREKANAELENFFTLKNFAYLFSAKTADAQNIHSADDMSRLTTDVSIVTQTVTYTIPVIIYAIFQLIITLIYLLWLQPGLTLGIICIMPIMLLLGNHYTKKILPISRSIRSNDTIVNEYMQEHLQHHEILVAYGLKKYLITKVKSLQDELYKSIKKKINLDIAAETFVELGFSLGYLIILIWGAYGIRQGNFTYSLLIVFMQLLGQLQRPFIFFKTEYPALINSFASIERLIEIENLPKEEENNRLMLQGAIGIKFSNVTFKYSRNDRLIFDNFSFDFPPNSTTAIIGETGIGKSTLFRLILSFQRPSKGTIFFYNGSSSIEATDIARCNCTFIPQGNSLISGTVRYNLLLGNPNANNEDIKDALFHAAAEFVYEDLPNGVDTVIGERGIGLSEGQAQRIAIARGLLHGRNIILLDEPTSALDQETEQKLLQRLSCKFYNKTVLIISHKKSISKYVDQTLLIDTQYAN